MQVEIEDKQFDFISKDFKRPVNHVKRISVNGKRYYYEMVNGVPVIYASGTTLISNGYPAENDALTEWKIKQRMMGVNPEEYTQWRAYRGTILHTLFGQLIEGSEIPFANMDKHILGLKIGIPKSVLERMVEKELFSLRKDLLCLAQWMKDYNVKPFAVELMMASKEYGVATAVDLICELDVEVNDFHKDDKGEYELVYKADSKATGAKKGDPRSFKKKLRMNAVIDLKSGKSFFPKHVLQLQLNKKMVEENYPDFKVDKMFNLSPKEWKGDTPTYNFKDQTEDRVCLEMEHVFAIGKLRHDRKSKFIKVYKGKLKASSSFESSDFMTSIPLEQYIVEIENSKNASK